jgi:hypothetical protein
MHMVRENKGGSARWDPRMGILCTENFRLKNTSGFLNWRD